MIEKNFDTYLSISSTTLSAAVFNVFTENNFFFKEYNCATNLKENELNLNTFEALIEKIIFEIEKVTGTFLNDLNLMVDTPETMSISLSLFKYIEDKKIQKKDAEYLAQDAKQQILRSYPEKNIVHVIVTNYIIDNISYEQLPLNINCKKFCMNIQFICLSKKMLKKIEEIFNAHQISINKIICGSYAQSFGQSVGKINICQSGFKINHGVNKREVVIIDRKSHKIGFFEKLFHFFK